jgi:uncharacterized membrane protein YheB (UPF0754 family)
MDWKLIYNIITIPVFSAFVGWVTTFLAIKMIFRPREPKRIFGLTFQGIVPKKRHVIAMSIGRSVERNMISVEDFEEIIAKINLEEEIGKIIDKYVDEKFAPASEKSFVGRGYNAFMGGMKNSTKAYLTKEISKNASAVIKSFVERVETEFDIQDIVAKRIDTFDIETLENVVLGFTKGEFKFLEIMGGVFGFIIGIAQAVVMLIIRYAA